MDPLPSAPPAIRVMLRLRHFLGRPVSAFRTRTGHEQSPRLQQLEEPLLVTTQSLPAGQSTCQADTADAELVRLWLHGRSPHTQRAYQIDCKKFLAYVAPRPLIAVRLGDLQAFADSLVELKPVSRRRTVAAVKSLLTFGHRLGYLPFNVGGAVKNAPVKEGSLLHW